MSPLRNAQVAAFLAALCGTAAAACRSGPPVRLEVVTGVGKDGRATGDWLALLRKRLPSEQADSFSALQVPLTPGTDAWRTLAGAHAPRWEAMIAPIAALYRPAVPPERVRIVLGNRGGDDAFTHDDRTIGFDLSALQAAYGDASLPENADRLDRFFRHEFSHLMQKAWLALHPWTDGTPQGAALLDIWTEGLGNYYSLSSRLVGEDGTLTETAVGTLETLGPRFAAHLGELACIDSAAARPILQSLSSGPFDRKWGALPAALWLAAEAGPADSALRRFIVAGPAGVWDLAERHLPGALRPALYDARAAHARCSGRHAIRGAHAMRSVAGSKP